MTESLSSFASLFRAVLILHGREAPIAKPDCVRATVKLLRLDPAPFERIFAIRATGERPATDAEANDVFSAYMAQVEQVVEAVDERKLEETPDHKQTAQWLVIVNEKLAGDEEMNHKRTLLLSLVVFVPLMGSGCGYNTLTSKQNVKAKWANVETQLQRRGDLLNNLLSRQN